MVRRKWGYIWVGLLLVLSVVLAFFARAGTISAVDSALAERSGVLGFRGEEFRILHLSDVQLANMGERRAVYPIVKEAVQRAAPDLIVLTGDNLHDDAKLAVLEDLVRFMDGFCIPWASVPGNHERGVAFSEDAYIAALEQSRYGLFVRGTVDGRWGNYALELQKNGSTVMTLLFMDSGTNGFCDEQITWYEQTLSDVHERAGRVLPSFAFFHIPVAEAKGAHEAFASDPLIGSGECREHVDTQAENGFFEAVRRIGSTKALFYGHDHINNTHINYQGVLFAYALKSGKSCYWHDDMLGGNLITVRQDGSFAVERLFVQG